MKFAVACLIANVAAIRIATPCSDAGGVAAADATHTQAHASIANCFVAPSFAHACPEGQVAAADATHTVQEGNCWRAPSFAGACPEGQVATADATHTVKVGNCYKSA